MPFDGRVSGCGHLDFSGWMTAWGETQLMLRSKSMTAIDLDRRSNKNLRN
jgi:hypothetical protein